MRRIPFNPLILIFLVGLVGIGLHQVTQAGENHGVMPLASNTLSVLSPVHQAVLYTFSITSFISFLLFRFFGGSQERRRQIPPAERRPGTDPSPLGSLGRLLDSMIDKATNPHLPHKRVHQLTHEIKNPLTGILLAALAFPETECPDKRKALSGQIVSQVDRIQKVIDRMLLLASLERRECLNVRQSVALGDVIEACLLEMTPLLEDRDLQVALDLDVTLKVHADVLLLTIVFENVLANAVEFSPVGGTLHVVVESEGSLVMIVIRDEGPGIPEEDLERIHEVFVSLPRPGSDHSGTGLGLSIITEIVSLHGGHWTLSNHPEGGAIAKIYLPSVQVEDIDSN